MTASWDERPQSLSPDAPLAGVAQTAAHGGVPLVPPAVEAPTSTSAGTFLGRIGIGLIGRFDLRDLIIVTIGFSVGFALVRVWEEWGLVLALITLPAVGRVIYVKRRLESAGESLTWRKAAWTYAGSLIVMIVAVIFASWFGLLVGLIATVLVGIVMYLATVAIGLPNEFAGDAVFAMSAVTGIGAGVVVLLALPRFFWRRWDRQLAERENRHLPAPSPSDEANLDTKATGPVVAAEAASRTEPQARKQRRYDGNPRRF